MLNAKSDEPMPRIEAPSTAVEPENGVDESSVTFGEIEVSAEISPIARSLSAAAVNAEIAIGTFWTFSARFCAVTTISAMPPESDCGCTSCAKAGDAISAIAVTEEQSAYLVIFIASLPFNNTHNSSIIFRATSKLKQSLKHSRLIHVPPDVLPEFSTHCLLVEFADTCAR